MTRLADVSPGDSVTYSRTFTTEEVTQFAELSEDEGYHHLVADQSGTVMVHGLLTATLPTKFGGDIDYVARSMAFEFPRPVYTGETITCEVTVEDLTETDDRTELGASFVCTDEDDAVVLRGESEGVIFG
ncbi:MAG: dehydratase [Halobacteriota archaeon]